MHGKPIPLPGSREHPITSRLVFPILKQRTNYPAIIALLDATAAVKVDKVLCQDGANKALRKHLRIVLGGI